MHRYKSLTGFSIYAFGIRYVLRTRYACGREWIYIISNLPSGKYIDFSVRKNIELRSNISTKIATRKELYFLLFG